MTSSIADSTCVLDSVREDDWPLIQQWMGAEGWNLPAWEVELLQQSDAARILVLRDDDGPLGCGSTFHYPSSGWIGNLLIKPEARGQGLGRRLFEALLQGLGSKRSVWLTASASGLPLYTQYDFQALEHVLRWTLEKTGPEGPAPPVTPPAPLLRSDSECWLEDRSSLLLPLIEQGLVLHSGSTSALLQAGNSFRVLGPWYTDNLCPRECREILSTALDVLLPGQSLVTDILAGSPVAPMLQAMGFVCSGKNTLMVLGEAPDLAQHLSLASLGSVG